MGTPDGQSNLTDVEFARWQRNHKMPAERALWDELRGKKTGYRFRCQAKIGPYFVDFLCSSHKVIVEVDGESHSEPKDRVRDAELGGMEFLVLRFSNEEVLRDPVKVARQIATACEGRLQQRY